jgi:hypothetical protein
MYEDGTYPTWPLNDQTLLFGPATNRQVASLDGRIVFPVGSEIELYDSGRNAHGTATVIKIRLLNGTDTVPHQVCLDVEVDDRWWATRPRD